MGEVKVVSEISLKRRPNPLYRAFSPQMDSSIPASLKNRSVSVATSGQLGTLRPRGWMVGRVGSGGVPVDLVRGRATVADDHWGPPEPWLNPVPPSPRLHEK